MYIAIVVMCSGILAGRLFAGFLRGAALNRLIFFAILFLLFLLGLQIGANDALCENLARLGLQAALLMLACVGGSILAVSLIAKALSRHGINFAGQRNKDEG